MKLDRSTGKVIRIQFAQNQIRVGNGRLVTTTAITGWSRFRTRTFWPHTNLAHGVDMGQRPTTSANFNHINHRNRNRHARALFETVGASDLKDARCLWGLVLDQTNLGRGAAHVKGQDLVQPITRRGVGGKNSTTRRTRFNQTHREVSCALNRNDSTARVHQKD